MALKLNGLILIVCLIVAGSCQKMGQNYPPDILPPNMEEEECHQRSTCLQSSGFTGKNTTELHSTNMFLRNCFCDPLCVSYGDCCSDISDALKRNINPWDNYKIPRKIADNTFECIDVRLKRLRNVENIFMVNKCPPNFEDESARQLCEKPEFGDVFANIPVTDNDYIVYQNKYCSLCHGVDDTIFWQVEIECSLAFPNVTSDDLEEVVDKYMKSGECASSFVAPDLSIQSRTCKRIEKSCPESWVDQKVKEDCERTGHDYVYKVLPMGSKAYKNAACALCNNVTDHICQGIPSFFLKSSQNFFYPLSFILDINTKSGDSTGYAVSGRSASGGNFNSTLDKASACDDGYVYDVFHQKCRALVCPPGSVLHDDGECSASNSTIDCPMIRLNSSEFVLLTNGDLYANLTQELHGHGAYILEGDTALVCTNFSQDYSSDTIPLKFSTAQTIISVIGQLISIICLIIHLVVYSMFRKLRNLAGLNIMCLSACLLLAQLFFLLAGSASGSYPLCFAVGVLVHYFFLCSFLWMNVMAFDICRTFIKFSSPSSSSNTSKKFGRYCIYSFITSLIIVSLALILNFTLTDSLYRPGYGEGVCWIKFRLALIVFFALPVALLILSNVICFVLTLCSIQKTAKISKMATNKKNDKQRFWLYVKLSTIMGLTWVFGFIAAIFDVSPLWYLFLIFNSLQGAMICIAFVCTKQVFGLLREKFSKQPYTDSELATRTSRLTSQSADDSSSHLISKKKSAA